MVKFIIKMDYLTYDTLSYLVGIIINNDYKDLASFIISRQMKLIVDKVVNDKLKINYKILIRNNMLMNPLHAYNNLYKIYKNKYVLETEKVYKLLTLSINNNNLELIDILNKTIPNTIKSLENKLNNIKKYENFRETLKQKLLNGELIFL